jgi:hypothetical protein
MMMMMMTNKCGGGWGLDSSDILISGRSLLTWRTTFGIHKLSVISRVLEQLASQTRYRSTELVNYTFTARLIGSFLYWKLRFNPTVIHVGFLVDKSHWSRNFFCQSLIQQCSAYFARPTWRSSAKCLSLTPILQIKVSSVFSVPFPRASNIYEEHAKGFPWHVSLKGTSVSRRNKEEDITSKACEKDASTHKIDFSEASDLLQTFQLKSNFLRRSSWYNFHFHLYMTCFPKPVLL